jgi:hypothetical protein
MVVHRSPKLITRTAEACFFILLEQPATPILVWWIKLIKFKPLIKPHGLHELLFLSSMITIIIVIISFETSLKSQACRN